MRTSGTGWITTTPMTTPWQEWQPTAIIDLPPAVLGSKVSGTVQKVQDIMLVAVQQRCRWCRDGAGVAH